MNVQVATLDDGVEGNSRLTAVNGMVLLVLLAIEGVTVLSVRQMITLHIYLGVLLAGPVLLKCASTGYRFVRYYARVRPYLDKGPPRPILRILGPVVVLSSLAVLGTGIGLIFAGPAHPEPLLSLHKASFIVWVAAMTVHVLGHLIDGARTAWREVRAPRALPAVGRRSWRTLAVAMSLLAGVGLASALLPSASVWTSHRLAGFDHQSDRGKRSDISILQSELTGVDGEVRAGHFPR